jgi:hypothetical protein
MLHGKMSEALLQDCPRKIKRPHYPKSRDRTSDMFVGQVVDLGLNLFPSFFSREECGHAVRLSSGVESAALRGP